MFGIQALTVLRSSLFDVIYVRPNLFEGVTWELVGPLDVWKEACCAWVAVAGPCERPP